MRIWKQRLKGVNWLLREIKLGKKKSFWESLDEPAIIFKRIKFDSDTISEIKDKEGYYLCEDCGHIWKTRNKYSGSYKCPKCHSEEITLSKNFKSKFKLGFMD